MQHCATVASAGHVLISSIKAVQVTKVSLLSLDRLQDLISQHCHGYELLGWSAVSVWPLRAQCRLLFWSDFRSARMNCTEQVRFKMFQVACSCRTWRAQDGLYGTWPCTPTEAEIKDLACCLLSCSLHLEAAHESFINAHHPWGKGYVGCARRNHRSDRSQLMICFAFVCSICSIMKLLVRQATPQHCQTRHSSSSTAIWGESLQIHPRLALLCFPYYAYSTM